MYFRNVSACGIMGGSHFLYTWVVIILCLICCFVFPLWVGCHHFLHLLYLFSSWFSSQRQTVAAILRTRLRTSDVKTPKLVVDASKPKVMYIVWQTFKLSRLFGSVFVTESVLALSECDSPGGKTEHGRGWFPLQRLYFTQTSELCLFLCNRTQTHRETISWSLYWDPYVDCRYIWNKWTADYGFETNLLL